MNIIKINENPKLIFGKCNTCGKNFQPEVTNGKITGMKYYCSEV